MIAFTHFCGPKAISGVTTWLEGLLLYLRSRNLPVSAYLTYVEGRYQQTGLERRLMDAGVKVVCARAPRFSRRAVREVLDFLEHQQPALFLPQCFPQHMYAAQICGREGLPWIFTHHSDDPIYWAMLEVTRPETNNGHVVAVSTRIADLCRTRHPPSTPSMIPYGVRPSDRTVNYKAGRFRVVYCGRVVEPQKRISLVVQTFIELCKHDPEIECRVLGDGAELALCTRTVAMHGLAGRITFSGQLHADELTGELLQAHAILFMSDYEGLPLALLEAMSAGVVPVCRLIPSGIPEVVNNNVTGLLVDGDPVTTAQRILALKNDPATWAACSRNAAVLVRERYDATSCHARWFDLIARLSRPDFKFKNPPGALRFTLPPLHPNLQDHEMRPENAPRIYAKFIAKTILRRLGR